MRLESLIARTAVDPRPYQRRIIAKALDMFQGRYKDGGGETVPAARSVMIESPTGSGKTIMGLLTAKALQDELGVRVGWVAMRRNLLAQAEAENINKDIDVDGIEFISMFDKNPPTDIDLLVVDEAQHDAASSMAHLHNVIKPKYILGMTATPFRTDRVKLCFDQVIKDAGIHQLIQDGYLAQYHHYTIPKWDAETLSDFYCRDAEKWGKSIFFFHKLDDCFELNSLLHERGVVSDVVTGSSDRESQLAAFTAGDMPVLINCMVLTEGFDCPDLKTVFCRPSGRGPTVQMCGRAFRQHESLPFKQVVQDRQTKWPFLKTALPEQQFLWQEDGWRSLTVNPHLNQINANARMAIASTEVEMPKFINEKKGARKVRF